MPSKLPPKSPAVRQTVTPNLFAPLPDVSHSVLAEVEDDVARLLLEDRAHLRVRFLQRGPVGVLDHPAVRAPVVLEEIEAPLDKLPGVFFLVLVRAHIAPAGQRPGRRVNARLQSQTVNMIGSAFMSGKRRFGLTLPCESRGSPPSSGFGIARLDGPAIININIHIAMINHSGADHGVGRVANDLVGDVVFPDVPAIPAHVGRERQGLSADDLERGGGRAVGVGCLERDRIGTGLRQSAAELAGFGIDGQPLGKPLRRVMKRSIARGGNLEQEGRAGPDAENPRR